MESPIERFRLSETAKEQLTQLKRSTKIEQWNILCRWAFCRSLAEPSLPSAVSESTKGGIELTWRVFGGELSDILLMALKQRCHEDGLATDRGTLIEQFRLHVHRGIGYLVGEAELQTIEALTHLVPPPNL